MSVDVRRAAALFLAAEGRAGTNSDDALADLRAARVALWQAIEASHADTVGEWPIITADRRAHSVRVSEEGDGFAADDESLVCVGASPAQAVERVIGRWTLPVLRVVSP